MTVSLIVIKFLHENHILYLNHMIQKTKENNNMPENVKPPKNSVPTAAEAKNATELAKENFIAKQLEKLSSDINNAANSGRYDIKNDGTLCLAVKRRLKDLGYEVIIGYKCTNGNQYEESYYTISWR